MMGLPAADRDQLKRWSEDFAEILGNFQYHPDRSSQLLKSVNDMCTYFQSVIRDRQKHPHDDLINALVAAEIVVENF